MLGGGAVAPPGTSDVTTSSKKCLDTSWSQVDVSKLISDLDEDIRNEEMEKGGGGGGGDLHVTRPPLSMHAGGGGSMAGPGGAGRVPVSSSVSAKVNSDEADKSLKMKIKRTKSGRQEIVKSDSGSSSSSRDSSSSSGKPGAGSGSSKSMNGDMTAPGGSSGMNGPPGGLLGGAYNSSSSGSGSAPVSSSASSSGGDSGPPSSSGESSPLSPHPGSPSSGKSSDFHLAVTDINGICNNKTTSGDTSSSLGGYNPLSSASIQMLTSKKLKVDVGTVTDASTVTEPEILGPCEPGTPVNLDGIVWHETDTGVLVVNVTWRGKTYVGTLLDCARHTNQWSAPRFTDSPEPGGKGRGKRSRNSATPQELEPRKNLRSSKGKGKGGKGSKGSAALPAVEDEFNFPAPASPKEGGKRKKEGGDVVEDSKKRKRTSSDSDDSGANQPESEEQQQLKPPPVPVKREPKPVVYSYTMLECPRKDCSKQYKAEDGLRWHVSHSHPEFIGPDGEMRDSAEVEREEQERKEEQERRRRRQEKEERKKKEASSRQESSGEKGTPAKQIKLEESKSQPTTPVPDATKAKAPSFPAPTASSQANMGMPPTAAATAAVVTTTTTTTVTTPSSGTPSQVSSAAPPWNPEVQALPNPDARLFEDNLKKMKATIDSLSASPVVSNAGPASTAVTSASVVPRPQSVEKSKVPATSPAAFSDISDDGDDARIKDLKLNTSLDAPGIGSRPPIGGIGLAPPPGGLAVSSGSLAAPPSRSSPLALPRPPPPASSSNTTTLPRSSISLPGSGVPGPEPGTPEYHKYLAANGFPPFPYPYPVGMDPAYHIQLLKSDPVYKAKWEKDRAEREKAFKEQLDKDQGRFSGLSLVKEDRLQASQNRKQPDNSKPEDLRKREPSGDSRPTSRASPMISVKPEFREKEELKKEVKPEDQGVKPTMETRGPPPGPQTFGYMHPSLVRPPYSIGGIPPPFDPMFVSSGVSPYGLPPGLPGVPSPYLNPSLLGSSPRPPAPFSSFGAAEPLLRAPFPLGTAEDLARAAGAPPSLSGTKALDLLQHHASQYYANQKLAELQERALKSPISSMSSSSMSSRSGSPLVSKPITTLAGGKDVLNPSSAAGVVLPGSKSPPPLRHVHTHTHTHIGLGYPLLPPGALPSVPSGIPPVGSLPPGALPPPPVGVGSVPFSSPSGAYPGKSPT